MRMPLSLVGAIVNAIPEGLDGSHSVNRNNIGKQREKDLGMGQGSTKIFCQRTPCRSKEVQWVEGAVAFCLRWGQCKGHKVQIIPIGCQGPLNIPPKSLGTVGKVSPRDRNDQMLWSSCSLEGDTEREEVALEKQTSVDVCRQGQL